MSSSCTDTTSGSSGSTECGIAGPQHGLPLDPCDGQLFIDVQGVRWHYDIKSRCWRSDGNSYVPLVGPGNVGLLSKEHKFLLDAIAVKGGGYAIVTKPFTSRRTLNNPDGVVFGDVELLSQTLDLTCNNFGPVIEGCDGVEASIMPSVDLALSEKFLRGLCIEVSGGLGAKGELGEKGLSGPDGTGESPEGDVGEDGDDALIRQTLTGIKIVDLEETTDVAVVNLELNQENSVLFLLKGKVRLPLDSATPAQRLLAKRLSRSVTLIDKTINCWKFELKDSNACDGASPDTPKGSDPLVAMLPEHFSPNKQGDFQPVKYRFSSLVGNMIADYQKQLDVAAVNWDKEIQQFLLIKDTEVRKTLAELLKELTDCQASLPLDICVGVTDDKQTNETVTKQFSPLFVGLGLPAETELNELGIIELTATQNPVFSFEAIDAPQLPGKLAGTITQPLIDHNGVWVIYPEGTITYVPCGVEVSAGAVVYHTSPCTRPIVRPEIIPDSSDPAQQLAQNQLQPAELVKLLAGHPTKQSLGNFFNQWATELKQQLENGDVLYQKQQLKMSDAGAVFPAGKYLIAYAGGAFRQAPLNQFERYDIHRDDARFINGKFQNYFVGNEGNGQSRAPLAIYNPFDNASNISLNAPLASTEIGLEIGHVALTYKDLVPPGYFLSHRYSSVTCQGQAGVYIPPIHVDFVGLPDELWQQESTITWMKFPALNGSGDLYNLQNGYLGQPEGVLLLELIAPSYIFARVKLAYSALNVFGSLIMPPVNSLNYSENVAQICEESYLGYPVVNCRPTGEGMVKLQLLEVS